MARAFTPKNHGYGGFCLSSIEVQWGVERVGSGPGGGVRVLDQAGDGAVVQLSKTESGGERPSWNWI